jgi:hypothetical protein
MRPLDNSAVGKVTVGLLLDTGGGCPKIISTILSCSSRKVVDWMFGKMNLDKVLHLFPESFVLLLFPFYLSTLYHSPHEGKWNALCLEGE